MTAETMPPAYAGLTRDQAMARVFFQRIQEAEGLGMSTETQQELHAAWVQATTFKEKQQVAQRVFLWNQQVAARKS